MGTYLDNSATTSYPKPECVYEAMDSFMHFNGASAGRGNYTRAREAEEPVAWPLLASSANTMPK